MKLFILIAVLTYSTKALATSYECTVKLQNPLNFDVSVIYTWHNPALEQTDSELKKIVVTSNSAGSVSTVNYPFILIKSMSPLSKIDIPEKLIATSCNSGGTLVIEKRT
ncbi:hypothetical protein [Alteromonas sp. KUL49]|uniref:hypothetical protein n=1 Tax=Alteromonas sp. KUL49 TaxID=2480798 RepID=UPI00102EDA5C|nr:hypothetical protein [Alteromonas sp. KUL49]TAP39049.1 hypothetical protein EYS00_14280 [Alteromonas sp. KUL49]GEA12509.1 hypothetical protein KUL49_28840 [Alteromonas sp. KUL49]